MAAAAETAAALSQALHALASPATAKVLQGFFKTGPGQYGEGDVFLGIKVPTLRTLARQHRSTELPTLGLLLRSRYHEERLFALLLLMQYYAAADAAGRDAAYALYLDYTQYINNWDLVDVSAPHLVGRHLQTKPRNVLDTLARSASLWDRRIAIVATFHFIRQHDFDWTLRLAETLLGDEHDLMHKAVGWMLREVGKRDQAVEEHFLLQHYRNMPRTMLRYAIERFDEPKRLAYLRGSA